MRKAMKTHAKAFSEVFAIVPGYLTAYFIIAVLGIGADVAATYLNAIVFDGIRETFEGNMAREALYGFLIMFLVLYLLQGVLHVVIHFIREFGFSQKATFIFRVRMGEHAAKLGLKNYENPEYLDKMERAYSNVKGEKMTRTMDYFFRVLTTVGGIIGITAVLASFSVWLVPLAVLSCVPAIVSKVKRGKRMYDIQWKRATDYRRLQYFWKLFLSPVHIKEMRTLGFSGYLSDKWEGINTETNEERWAFHKKEARTMFFLDIFRVFCYMLGLVISVWLVFNETITIGQFGACIAAFLTMQWRMQSFAVSYAYIAISQKYVEDLFDFFAIKPEERDENEFTGIKDSLELKNVSFRYPNTDEDALNGINLTIRKGEKIALIGENGSGKTTLSKLMLGLYPPSAGEITLDGEDLKAYNLKSFYEHFSMVSQDFVKYALLLRENVALGDIAKINEDEPITTTIERASAEEVLERTGGLDGMLGREFEGTELSGGQWQKLAIARGLFKDYDFIVLDEPTSALDPIVETDIFKKFLDAMDNKTALIISHRVGLCRLADRIVVLKDGEICEVGSHDELMAKQGHYYELFTSQQMWYV